MKNIYLKIAATVATPAILSGAIAFNTSDAKAATFECTDAIGCVTITPKQPIDIAVLQTLSGFMGSTSITLLDWFQNLNADVKEVRENIIASFTPGQTTSVPEPYSILGLLGLGL